MRYQRLNAYRIMWIFVMFDLPVGTKSERKIAQEFRKSLLKDGFSMKQFSVYIRHCASLEDAEVHISRLKAIIPDKGHVVAVSVTDKQFSRMHHFWGGQVKKPREAPPQLQLF